MKNHLYGILLLLLSTKSVAVNNLIVDPSPQSTLNTCQSYSIAYSLAHSGLWHEEIQTPKELRELEKKVRSAIDTYVNEEKSRGKDRSSYHHTAWVEAVKRVSSNNLKLKLHYPSTPNKYYQKISDITGFTSSDIFEPSISAALVKMPVMTSVKKLNSDSYESGHIVTLLGLANSLPINKSLASMNQKILILNSAIKSNQKTFNMCSEEITSGDNKYSASINITNDYLLKSWNGKYLLMWIEKANN